MKKIYIAPVSEEIVLKYQLNLLVGSLIDGGGNAEIVDDGGGIVDDGGLLDPDARSFEEDFGYEDLSSFD